jgi:CRP/FNR family transcriptional regulator, anaerobic regulatory protein
MNTAQRSISTAMRTIGTKAAPGVHAPAKDSGWCNLKDVCQLLAIPSGNIDSDLQFQRRRIKTGQWAFGAGEKFDAVYIVYSGFLKNVLVDEAGNEQILGFPMKGDVLGVDGLHADCYASQAIALTDCELVVIPFRELSHLGHEYAMLENWLYRAISRELVREHAVIGLLGTLGAEARVARFLMSLSTRFAALGYSSTEFNLRMTRQEIGSYLGLTLETVSRSLSALHDAGLISVHQRAVVVMDPEALRTLQRLPASKAASTKHVEPVTKPRPTRRDNSIWANLAAA